MKKTALISTLALVVITSNIAFSDEKFNENPEIGILQAIEIATTKIPGFVHEAEFEHQDDKQIWEIELISNNDNKHYELIINSKNGAIIDIEHEEDDDWGWFSKFHKN